MKKIFFALAALAAMTAISCTKEAGFDTREEFEQVPASLNLTTRALATRAAADVNDSAAERTINHVEVFFFRQDDGQTLDAYYEFTSPAVEGQWETPNTDDANNDFVLGSAADPMYVSNTTLDCYVVVNAPANGATGYIGDQVTSVATLKQQISQFTVNTTSNFVMIGRLTGINMKAIEAVSGLKTISGPVELERMCNKVILHTLTKDFVSDAFQSADVKLEGLYLVNAVKEAKYDEVYTAAGARTVDAVPTAADASYYNATFSASSDWADNDFITWTAADNTEKITVTAAGATVDKCLYFYPNPALEAVRPAAVGGVEQPLPKDYVSKIVLKVKIGDNHYWYPIALNQAQIPTGGTNHVGDPMATTRNLVYVIDELVLLKAGGNANKSGDEENTPDDDTPYTPTEDPGAYIENNSVSLQLRVLDWVSGEIVGSYNGIGWGTINP